MICNHKHSSKSFCALMFRPYQSFYIIRHLSGRHLHYNLTIHRYCVIITHGSGIIINNNEINPERTVFNINENHIKPIQRTSVSFQWTCQKRFQEKIQKNLSWNAVERTLPSSDPACHEFSLYPFLRKDHSSLCDLSFRG